MVKKMKAAVSGFRHGHIGSIINSLKKHPDIEIVACSEEEPEKCSSIIASSGVKITHRNLEAMLEEADFDILALGDVYTKRGGQAVKALEADRHVLSDKPLCTESREITRIKELAEEKNLSVIIALTLRYSATLQTARRMILDGTIGEVADIIVTGHHGLMYRTGRPDWYFEEGLHGGTINDIMIHGVDAVPWLTGLRFSSVLSALTGHFEPAGAPFFQDIAKAFLKLENGGGVFMDASYKTPAGHPAGWEFSLWGTGGYMNFKAEGEVIMRRHNEPEEKIAPEKVFNTDFVNDLVCEIRRTPGHKPVLSTHECLLSTGHTLAVEEAARAGDSGAELG